MLKRTLIVIAVALGIVGCISCPEKDYTGYIKVDKQGTFIEATPKSDSVPPLQIVVSSAMVTRTSAFGYLPEGSALFDYNRCEKGYIIQVKSGQKVISTSYCSKALLQSYIDIVKYKMSVRDSIAYTIPLK